jgi:phage protein D
MAELVAAHGLVEAGAGPVKSATRKAADWLRRHLPSQDQPTLAALETQPGSRSARSALEIATNALLEARPELLAEVRALLTGAHSDYRSQQQTIGDNGRAIQNQGRDNTISISG